MLTQDKITEIYCIADEFCKNFDQEVKKISEEGKHTRNRSCEMSESEIMTILIMYHFGGFDNFKFYYQHYIYIHLKRNSPKTLSYSRFVQLESRVFISMMFFLATVYHHFPYLLLSSPFQLNKCKDLASSISFIFYAFTIVIIENQQ